MPQLNVRDNLRIAAVGQVADGAVGEIVKRANEIGQDTDIGFGLGLTVGATLDDVRLAESGEQFEGISARAPLGNRRAEPDAQLLAQDDPAFRPGQAVATLRKGRIWVIAEKAVSKGDSVFVRHTASGGDTVIGRLTNVDDANTDAVPTAQWRSTTAADGELALVEINLP